MIINTSQIELFLNNKALSAYSIEQATGLRRSNINDYRNGKRKLENFSLKSLMKLQTWINENFHISYEPYIGLLEELQADYTEGLISDIIYIERGDFDERLGCSPIIDYYSPEEFDNSAVVEIRQYNDVIEELKKYSKIQ